MSTDIGYGQTTARDPASRFAAVTPSASVELDYVTRGLWIGTGGTVVAVNDQGNEVTFSNVPDGTLLPIRTSRIDDTSTATNIVAMW